MIKVKNMTSSTGSPIVNQFIIIDDGNKQEYLQSYDVIIAKKQTIVYSYEQCKITLDVNYWNYSKTTSKYRNIFLNETTKETKKKIKSGEYILADLNN